jgi:hypothetical protein
VPLSLSPTCKRSVCVCVVSVQVAHIQVLSVNSTPFIDTYIYIYTHIYTRTCRCYPSTTRQSTEDLRRSYVTVHKLHLYIYIHTHIQVLSVNSTPVNGRPPSELRSQVIGPIGGVVKLGLRPATGIVQVWYTHASLYDMHKNQISLVRGSGTSPTTQSCTHTYVYAY